MPDASLTRQVAHLTAGDVITAVIHPTDDTAYQIGPCTLTETPAGALIIGDGWEAARLPDGTPPTYLQAIRRHITDPGLYPGIPEDHYHQGLNTPTPSLSQTLLKYLLPPSTPAHFQYRRHNPEGPRRVFDVGRAAHARVLGVGEEMAACPTEYLSIDGKMTTTKAKAWAHTQRANGVVPLSPNDYDTVRRMADALADHPGIAEVVTDPHRLPEVSAYAPHPTAGVWLRGRFDVLGGGLWDYKTSVSADPDHFRTAAWSYGYHLQDAVYRLLHELAAGTDPGPMRFMVQEKTPPYLASTVVLDDLFYDAARRQLDDALTLYTACTAAGEWPGYPTEPVTVTPPAWALRTLEQATDAVPLDPDFEAELARLAGLNNNPEGTTA